ncbi:MAG: dihydropteroate synthase [Candidatus Thermoplasmatota archaeon]|nr:dihydropteroate synthase [Candidatus Thermoplasmatota archaeon]
MSGNLRPDSVSGIDSLNKHTHKIVKMPQLMGILNITPDSFYAESRFNYQNVINRAAHMINNGADWLDVGGESTRPGATKISIEEELDRVIPIIKLLRKEFPEVLISIDTRNYQVARLAIENGANMVNDVSGLRDVKMQDLVLETGCMVCIMHMQGEPGSMQEQPNYDDVVEEVVKYLEHKAQELINRGHKMENIVIDPGIGFGKNHQHNLALMRAVSRFKQLGYSLLWGISRKSVIGKMTNKSDVSERLPGTLGSSIYAALHGVDILRVHDVDEHNDMLNVYRYLTD